MNISTQTQAASGTQPAAMNKGDMPPNFDKNKKSADGDDEIKADKDDAAQKAQVADDDLVKSMDALDAIIANSKVNRQQDLLTKASNGSITAEERAELAKSLTGDEQTETEALVKGLQRENDEEFAKAIDASSFLETFHGDLVKALESVSSRLEKSEAARDESFFVLAKGLRDLGRVALVQGQQIRGLTEALQSWGRAPERGPRSMGAGPLAKSFGTEPAAQGGPEAQGSNLTKGMILRTLNRWTEEAFTKGDSMRGEALNTAVVRFESSNQIDPGLLDEVRKSVQA